MRQRCLCAYERIRERVEDRSDTGLVGHPGRSEVLPDLVVDLGGKKHREGVVEGTPGTTDLLVVCRWRLREPT